MPETIKWYMPEAIDNSHVLEINEKTGWGKYLPYMKEPKAILSHLH